MTDKAKSKRAAFLRWAVTQVDLAFELRLDGWSNARIAEKLGITVRDARRLTR